MCVWISPPALSICTHLYQPSSYTDSPTTLDCTQYQVCVCVCSCLSLALTSRTRMRHTQSLICLPAVAGDFGGGSTVLCGSGQTDSECLHCGDAPSSCNSQDCRFNPFPAADSTNTYAGVIYKCEPGDGIPDPSSTHLFALACLALPLSRLGFSRDPALLLRISYT